MSYIEKALASAICILPALSLNAADWASIDLQQPWGANDLHHWHAKGFGRYFGSADIDHHPGNLKAADAKASVFFSHFPTSHTAFSWELGYSYMRLDWDKNPRFTQKNFNLAVASVALVTRAIEEWRWIANFGVSVDTNYFNFGKTGVYYGFLWGRWCCTRTFGMHFGIFGQRGIKNGYALPILGVDWRLGDHWQINAVFPLDFSLNYLFNDKWSLAVAGTGFGGPYRYPWRAHEGHGEYKHAIFQVFSTGVELDLNYKLCNRFKAGIGGGYNFGGWIFIKNEHNHHGKYYNFDGAPYGQANLSASF